MLRKVMSGGSGTITDVKGGIKIVLDQIENAYANRSPTIKTAKPFLVAVSKTKPIELINEAYSVGQRHFGENYVNELSDKGANEIILKECPEIKWHFIGHLQSNKINKVLKTPGLFMIETIDSQKLATSVDGAWERLKKTNNERLRVLMQINTSNEDEKSGIPPDEAIGLYRHIMDTCKNLNLMGIMTIGQFGHDYSAGPNPDFIALMKCHTDICSAFNLNPSDVHVSMGMSNDFEKAIEMGSSIVRVGSSIFGERKKTE